MQKMQGEFEQRTNPYEYMELTYEKTNLMVKVVGVTGFTTKKESKKAAKDTTSPKATGKKATTGATGKSAGKKKGGVSGKLSPTQIESMVVIQKEMCQPIFRYMPDRATFQRLITRCANIKDDVIKFEPYDKPEEAKDGNDLI